MLTAHRATKIINLFEKIGYFNMDIKPITQYSM
jgi:hypothetical protein